MYVFDKLYRTASLQESTKLNGDLLCHHQVSDTPCGLSITSNSHISV